MEEACTRIRADDGAAYRRHSRNSCILLHADLIRGDKYRERELAEHVVTITTTFLRSYRPTRAGATRSREESRIQGDRPSSFQDKEVTV